LEYEKQVNSFTRIFYSEVLRGRPIRSAFLEGQFELRNKKSRIQAFCYNKTKS